MRRRTEGIAGRHIPVRESRIPLWRRLISVAVAAAFTVVMISLGLMRHRHYRDHIAGPVTNATSVQGERFQ